MILNEQEKRWRAEDDARTLQNYEEIKKDGERLKAATEILKEQVDHANSALNNAAKATGLI